MSHEVSTAPADHARLVFGFVPSIEGDRTRQALIDLCRAIGDVLQRDVAPMRVSSQEALERAMLEGRTSFGWFSPVVLARLELARRVVPIAQCHRDSPFTYHTCLVVREDSPVGSLTDLRASNVLRFAWVDPGSAAGYLIPRLLLMAEGILHHGDEEPVASSELFGQSHAEVVRMVVDGLVDVGATFVSLRGDHIVRAGWTDPDGSNGRPVRTIHRFGPIPGEAMAVSTTLAADEQAALSEAILSVAQSGRLRHVLRHLFGCESLRPTTTETFGALREIWTRIGSRAH